MLGHKDQEHHQNVANPKPSHLLTCDCMVTLYEMVPWAPGTRATATVCHGFGVLRPRSLCMVQKGNRGSSQPNDCSVTLVRCVGSEIHPCDSSPPYGPLTYTAPPGRMIRWSSSHQGKN